MKYNYHTHTDRCHHAVGREREYIEVAIERGLSGIGISDHCPMPFPRDYPSHRMTVAEYPEYIESLLALREEYRGRIEVYIGLEVEYYPLLFPELMRIISPYPLDYLILGQHFLSNEFDGGMAAVVPTYDENDLATYVTQTLEGLEKGVFSYLAHPDIFNYKGDDASYRRHMLPLIRYAKEQGIPLEYNLLGQRDRRNYPTDRFFRLVAEENAPVILGSDAHEPWNVATPEDLREATRRLSALGITPIEKLTFRPIPKTN